MSRLRRLWSGLLVLAVLPLLVARAQSPQRTRYVVLIVTDGLRWQEVFHGPDHRLMDQSHGGVQDSTALRRDFWRDSDAAGRRALLPFLWNVVAVRGQLFGNRDAGSSAQVTNGLKFSYPGYNEMLTGAPDTRIDRNSYGPNPNVTVFEWLNGRPGLRGHVAVFGTWEAFLRIFNRERTDIPVIAGWDPPFSGTLTQTQATIDEFYRTTTHYWDGNTFDAFMQGALLDYVRRERPRVLFVGYGETDEWAHEGRYDLLLRSAHQVDRFIEQLWTIMQSMPQYRGSTTFIISTDHGRGAGLEEWKNHGRTVDGAEDIWIAVLGPDTPPLGARADVARVTQSQIASTVAALLGQDFHGAFPGAAAPIAEAVKP
jgi:hypothetical protein